MSAENDDAIKKLEEQFAALVGDSASDASKEAAGLAAAVDILAERKKQEEEARVLERDQKLLEIRKWYFPTIDGLLARLDDLKDGTIPNDADTAEGNDTPGKLFAALVAKIKASADASQKLLESDVLKDHPDKDDLLRMLGVSRQQLAEREKNPIIDAAPPAPAGPDYSEVIKYLPQKNDHALIDNVIRALDGRGVDEYFGLGDIANAIGKKPKIAERILRALMKAGLVEQKTGMNEFRKKKSGATSAAVAAAPPVAPKPAPTGAPAVPPAGPKAPAAPKAPTTAPVASPKPTPAPAPAPTSSPAGTPTGAPKPLTGAPAMPTGAPPAPVQALDKKKLIGLSNEFAKAGNRIASLFDRFEQNGLTPEETKELADALNAFLENAKQQIDSGLALEKGGLKAYQDLSDAVASGSIDDPAAIRKLMNVVYQGLETSFGKQKFKIELPKAAAPVVPPAPAAPAPEPLKVGFKEGNFDVTMAQAFSNDVFYGFFKQFDSARHPTEEFDGANPNHEERFQKGLEAYVLWREAVAKFTGMASGILEQDLGIRPVGEDLKLLEEELATLVTKDTQKVRGMIDLLKKYEAIEEDEARKENEIENLGGVAKLKTQLDELGQMRLDKMNEVQALTTALNNFAKQRSDAAQAAIISKRSFLAAIDDRFRGVRDARSLDALTKGIFKGKEAAALEHKLASTYGLEISEAAGAYDEIRKQAPAAQTLVENAIREYEKIDQRYLQVKNSVELVTQAAQQKEQISNQFQQLRLAIFADVRSFGEIAKLTAGRARDTIKGMIDVTEPEKLPGQTEKAEEVLKGLRRASAFSFKRDLYGGIPEIAGSLTDEGEIIKEADAALNEKVTKALNAAVAEFTPGTSKNAEFLKKTILDFGRRGEDLAEGVLVDSIKDAQSKKDDRRANILQAVLFEVRLTIRNRP